MHLYHHVRVAPDRNSIWEIEADESGQLRFIQHMLGITGIAFESTIEKLSRPALFPKIGFHWQTGEPFVVCKFGVEGSNVSDDTYLIKLDGTEKFLCPNRGNNPCHVSNGGFIHVQTNLPGLDGMCNFGLFDGNGDLLKNEPGKYDSSGIHFIDNNNHRIMYMDTFGPVTIQGIKVLNPFVSGNYTIGTTDKHVNSGIVLFTPTGRKYFNHHSPHPAYVAAIGDFYKVAISGHYSGLSDLIILQDEIPPIKPNPDPPVDDCIELKRQNDVLHNQLSDTVNKLHDYEVMYKGSQNELSIQIHENEKLSRENYDLKIKLDRIPSWIRRIYKAW